MVEVGAPPDNSDSYADAITGGAQNIGAKKKESEKPKKTGGFRGLKGIM